VNQLAHEGEIERALEMTVEVILGNQRFQRDGDEGGKCPLFDTQHGGSPPPSRCSKAYHRADSFSSPSFPSLSKQFMKSNHAY
jgi:hypothetical protein